jgi:hypothetical protein
MGSVNEYSPIVEYVAVTIAQTASLSGAADLGGASLVAVAMPAAWTAANLTFQASEDGSTYNNMYDDLGNEYTVTAAASRYIVLDPSKFAGVRWIKARSGTATTAVNQTGERSINLIARPV